MMPSCRPEEGLFDVRCLQVLLDWECLSHTVQQGGVGLHSRAVCSWAVCLAWNCLEASWVTQCREGGQAA